MPDQKKKYGNINIIPLNKEKYLQFEIRELRFLDSYQFLSTSLEELVSLLPVSYTHLTLPTKRIV